jgi:Kef-type K+ transport system membrane component KefB/DNA-binding TFAR19-related protein (PDSD5 family)
MRRILIVGLLFLLMSALPFLQAEGEGAFNPKSLAALGFVLLAAFTGGELAARLRLPKITGYILAGLLCGPFILDLLSVGVVQDLKLVNSLAIGLIALTAGAELKISGLRAAARSIGLIVAVKVALILLFVIGTIFALRPMLPFLNDASAPLVAAIGLIFGVLAIETSPAATIAVINETGARGRLSDITLGVAVSKDVLMVVMLAVGISLAQLFSTPGARFNPAMLLTVGKELLLSAALGAATGAAIWAYLKYVHAEMWLFVISTVFVTTAVADRFHLEAVLVFIVAGFVVQNFTRFGDEFIHPVEAVSLPVYVVFFSIAGAGLDLGALGRVWLIPVILVMVRLAAIYAGSQLATLIAGEAPEIRRNAWLGFVSQAGIVLGLIIIVEKSLPGLGADMQPIVLGMVGLNLLIGPVLLKFALGRAGETREAREAAEAALASSTEVTVDGAPAAAASDIPLEILREYSEPLFESEELNAEARAFRDGLIGVERDFAARIIAPETRRIAQFLERMRDEAGRSLQDLIADKPAERPWTVRLRGRRSAYSRWLREEVLAFGSGPLDLSGEFRSLGERLLHLSETPPERVSVPEEADRFAALMDDGWRVRVGKRFKSLKRSAGRIFGGGESFRDAPLRRLAAYHFGGANDARLLGAAAAAGAQRLAALQAVKVLYDAIDEGFERLINTLEAESAADPRERLLRLRVRLEERFAAVGEEQSRFGRRVETELRGALRAAWDAWLADLAIAGTFELPPRRRSQDAAAEARQRVQKEIDESGRVWAAYREGTADACARHFDAVHLVDQVGLAVAELVAGVLDNVDRHLTTSLRAVLERLEEARKRLAQNRAQDRTQDRAQDRDAADRRTAIAGEREAMVNFLRGEMRSRLRRLRESRELGGMVETVLGRFAAITGDLPAEYRVIEDRDLAALGGLLSATLASTPVAPAPPKRKSVPLREIARGYLESEIARDLADVNRILYEQVDSALAATAEATQILEFNLKVAEESLDREGLTTRSQAKEKTPDLVEQGFERAHARIAAAIANLGGVEDRVRTEIISKVDERVREIEALAFQRATAEARREPSYIDLPATMRRAAHFTRQRLAAALRRYGPLGRIFVRDLQATLGFEQLSPEEALRRYDEARWDPARLAHLPYLYQRLFAVAPLDTADLLVGREEELRAITAAHARLRSGRQAAVAVIGELGSGKTSLIQAALREIFRHDDIFRLNLAHPVAHEEALAGELGRLIGMPRARTLAQIETRLGEMPGRPVMVIEDAHHIHLRAIGGYEALRALRRLIARTSHRVFWLVSIRRYAWQYLDSIERISEVFTFVVNTENLTAEEMSEVIARRHAVSGFELDFLPDPMLAERGRYRRAPHTEQQRLARAAYFDALGRASEGNILAGLFYWMRSIAEVQDNRLVVRPMEPLRFAALREAPVEHLLTLGVIVQQGSLTVDEHARIFLGGPTASSAVMERLSSLNLVVRETREDGIERFSINRPIYIPLVRELRARNVLPAK